MTKPIIINGVDVSECDFRTLENVCRVGIVCFCNEFPNCYYKQLKRIEQELKIQKQINKDCEIEYRRVVSQYNAVIDKGDIFDEYFEK